MRNLALLLGLSFALPVSLSPAPARASACGPCSVERLDDVSITVEPALDCLEVSFALVPCCDLVLGLANGCGEPIVPRDEDILGLSCHAPEAERRECASVPPGEQGVASPPGQIDGEHTVVVRHGEEEHTIRVTYVPVDSPPPEDSFGCDAESVSAAPSTSPSASMALALPATLLVLARRRRSRSRAPEPRRGWDRRDP